MRTTLFSAAVASALMLSGVAFADGKAATAKTEATTQKLAFVTIPELAQLKETHKVAIYDANGSDTRTKYGVIPGATLLSSFDKFDVKKELPADKTEKLVFYCGNTKCMASHEAAARATAAGYTNVAVLPDGIMGWKKAGQPTETPKS